MQHIGRETMILGSQYEIYFICKENNLIPASLAEHIVKHPGRRKKENNNDG